MSNIPDAFEFTSSEKSHPLWLRLKAYLEAELQALRARNDQPQTEFETATIRGEIKRLKRLIALDADRPLTGD